jgi:hypothetical protein
MSQIDKLVAERDALRREWQTNYAAPIKIQHRLDELTTQLSQLTGLPLWIGDVPTLDVPPALGLLAGGLGGRRRPRRGRF